MIRNLLLAVFGLFVGELCAFGQTQKDRCEIKIIKLRFEKTLESKLGNINDSLLKLAEPTTSVLANNVGIKKLKIGSDSACCNYVGMYSLTSHYYSLTKEAVSRLEALQIPLCCGIPIAVYINNREIYRAMLWNSLSSFANNSITATLFNDELIFVNQLPKIPDFRNGILRKKNHLVDCLLSR
jgi:hypothetical protein